MGIPASRKTEDGLLKRIKEKSKAFYVALKFNPLPLPPQKIEKNTKELQNQNEVLHKK